MAETHDQRVEDTRPGTVVAVLGGVAAVAGIVLLVADRPVGLLVLMCGCAVFVVGLDLSVLRGPAAISEQTGSADSADVTAEEDEGAAEDESDEDESDEEESDSDGDGRDESETSNEEE